MKIYCREVAVIEHFETSEVYEIYPDELDWQHIGSDQRNMGPEDIYQAFIEHEDLGELRWIITEYPTGSENYTDYDIGSHNMISNFSYGLEDEPEFEPTPAELHNWLATREDWKSSLTQSTLVDHLVHWFYFYYEDPANETPYNSREGGYQYVAGGPYNAEEELRDSFEGIVPEDIILRAVDELQIDGIIDWAPSSNHDDKISIMEEALADQYEREKPNLQELQKLIADDRELHFGSVEEQSRRKQVMENASDLLHALPDQNRHGGLGHNNPPEEIGVNQHEIEELRSRIKDLEDELKGDAPNRKKISNSISIIEKFLSWGAGKIDKTVDSFCESFGTNLGKAAAIALPAILSHPYWGKLAELAISLKDWLIIALGV